MYKPITPFWFLLAFVGCLVAFAIANVARRSGRTQLRIWQLYSIAGGAAVMLMLAMGLNAHNRSALRQEFMKVKPEAVSRIEITRGDLHGEIRDAGEIKVLLSTLQTLQPLGSHHSQPQQGTDIRFEYGGGWFQYQVGRDSERPEEYWVFCVGRSHPGAIDMEIGRVLSGDLGQLLDRLLKVGAGEPKP